MVNTQPEQGQVGGGGGEGESVAERGKFEKLKFARKENCAFLKLI